MVSPARKSVLGILVRILVAPVSSSLGTEFGLVVKPMLLIGLIQTGMEDWQANEA